MHWRQLSFSLCRFHKKKNDQSHLKLPTRCNRFMQVLQNHLAPDWKLQHAPPYTLWRIPNRKCTNLWSDQSWSTHFRIKTCRKQSNNFWHKNTPVQMDMKTWQICFRPWQLWQLVLPGHALESLLQSQAWRSLHLATRGHWIVEKSHGPLLPACSIYDTASEAIPLAESSQQNALSATQINHLGGRTCPKNGHQHGHTCSFYTCRGKTSTVITVAKKQRSIHQG